MIEGFNNPDWMFQADRVLKEIGKEKAQEYYKVGINEHQPVLGNLLGISCKVFSSTSKSAHIIRSFIFPSDPVVHAMNFHEKIFRFG